MGSEMCIRNSIRIGANDLNTNKKFTTNNPNMHCPFCKTEETELHFIKHCPTYRHQRAKYINPHFNEDNCNNLKDYFNTENTESLKALAQYVHHAFNTRREEIAFQKARNRHLQAHNQRDKATQTTDD